MRFIIIAFALLLAACGDVTDDEPSEAVAGCVAACEERNETTCYPEEDCAPECEADWNFQACPGTQPGELACEKDCKEAERTFCPAEVGSVYCDSQCNIQRERCERDDSCDPEAEEFSQEPECLQ